MWLCSSMVWVYRKVLLCEFIWDSNGAEYVMIFISSRVDSDMGSEDKDTCSHTSWDETVGSCTSLPPNTSGNSGRNPGGRFQPPSCPLLELD